MFTVVPPGLLPVFKRGHCEASVCFTSDGGKLRKDVLPQGTVVATEAAPPMAWMDLFDVDAMKATATISKELLDSLASSQTNSRISACVCLWLIRSIPHLLRHTNIDLLPPMVATFALLMSRKEDDKFVSVYKYSTLVPDETFKILALSDSEMHSYLQSAFNWFVANYDKLNLSDHNKSVVQREYNDDVVAALSGERRKRRRPSVDGGMCAQRRSTHTLITDEQRDGGMKPQSEDLQLDLSLLSAQYKGKELKFPDIKSFTPEDFEKFLSRNWEQACRDTDVFFECAQDMQSWGPDDYLPTTSTVPIYRRVFPPEDSVHVSSYRSKLVFLDIDSFLANEPLIGGNYIGRNQLRYVYSEFCKRSDEVWLLCVFSLFPLYMEHFPWCSRVEQVRTYDGCVMNAVFATPAAMVANTLHKEDVVSDLSFHSAARLYAISHVADKAGNEPWLAKFFGSTEVAQQVLAPERQAANVTILKAIADASLRFQSTSTRLGWLVRAVKSYFNYLFASTTSTLCYSTSLELIEQRAVIMDQVLVDVKDLKQPFTKAWVNKLRGEDATAKEKQEAAVSTTQLTGTIVAKFMAIFQALDKMVLDKTSNASSAASVIALMLQVFHQNQKLPACSRAALLATETSELFSQYFHEPRFFRPLLFLCSVQKDYLTQIACFNGSQQTETLGTLLDPAVSLNMQLAIDFYEGQQITPRLVWLSDSYTRIVLTVLDVTERYKAGMYTHASSLTNNSLILHLLAQSAAEAVATASTLVKSPRAEFPFK